MLKSLLFSWFSDFKVKKALNKLSGELRAVVTKFLVFNL